MSTVVLQAKLPISNWYRSHSQNEDWESYDKYIKLHEDSLNVTGI